MNTKLASGIAGIIFGLGLTVSGMINPEKVLGFLNIFGAWDPSLILVMGGALLVTTPMFFLSKNKQKPMLCETFSLPTLTKVDSKLILGASIFGIGWGLIGLCPGPAIASLAMLNTHSLIFVGSMIAGFILQKIIFK